MSLVIVEVIVKSAEHGGSKLLAPVGMPTPHQTALHFSVEGGQFDLTGETTSGQMVALITPEGVGDDVKLVYHFADAEGMYPESVFQPRESCFTRAADALVTDAQQIAEQAVDGHAAIAAIVAHTSEKFSYGHVDVRFNEGMDTVPHLGCGLTKGSCVDINTYLIASLRSAGLEAGYVTGYFFPQEKNGCCSDMHCWVVTRHNGVVLEWDIAHHKKMSKEDICCGLNPKPGSRVALAHSMGLAFPELGIFEEKLIAEPVVVSDEGTIRLHDLEIRMRLAGD